MPDELEALHTKASTLEREVAQLRDMVRQAIPHMRDSRDSLLLGHANPKTGEIEPEDDGDAWAATDVAAMTAWLERAEALAPESTPAQPAVPADQCRVTYRDDGHLDEVVTDGGCHLERLADSLWLLAAYRRDGTAFAMWVDGKVIHAEERPASGTAAPAAKGADNG